MINEMTTQILLPFSFSVILIAIVGLLYLNRLSETITHPIVELLEKLLKLSDAMKKGESMKDILSSFKYRNQEINTLHLGFSRFLKTI